MNYRVQVVRHTADLPQLEDAWTNLLLQTPGATVFASYQWNLAWWRHFGHGHGLYMVTVRTGEGRLVGLAPLMLARQGPMRRLQFIGTGLSDYGDFLVHPRFHREAMGALFSFLRARSRTWDLGDLSEVPAGSPLLGYLRSSVPSGLRARLVPQTPCPFVALPSTWDAYVSSLARKRRYYVSSFPRKFMREHDGRIDTVCDGSDVREAVAVFHELHMSRWTGRTEDLSPQHEDPAFLPFLQEVCASMAERGWLRVMSLRAGQATVASSLNFLLNGRWSAYMKGFDPAWSSARPGTVLDSLRIIRSIEENATTFDFGRGDEAYKSGYGLQMERNTRVLLGSNAPRSLVAYGLMLARITYKSRKKQEEPPARPEE